MPVTKCTGCGQFIGAWEYESCPSHSHCCTCCDDWSRPRRGVKFFLVALSIALLVILLGGVLGVVITRFL